MSNVTATGDIRQSNDCGGAVAPDQLCTIQLFFTPIALGARNGLLAVFDNTAVGVHSITMTGVGVSTHKVNLSWSPSTSSVIGYFVYRAVQSGGPYQELSFVSQPQTTFVDSVPGGATYYYVVTAADANGVENVTTPEVPATISVP